MRFNLKAAFQTPNFPILLFFSLAIVCSCKSSKELTKGSATKIDADSVLAALSENGIQFKWLYAKARVNYKDKSQSKNFTANIRLRKDSTIWISITTIMGVEAARLLMQNDSVFLIDKLNKKFQTERLSLLEKYFPFPFDVNLIQRILVGNAAFLEYNESKVKKEKGGYMIYSEDKLYRHTMNVNGADLTISTEHLSDKQNDRKLSLIFDDYKNEGGKLFSYVRKISFSGDEKISLDVKFSKVRWDEPQTFPFHVSDKYDHE